MRTTTRNCRLYFFQSALSEFHHSYWSSEGFLSCSTLFSCPKNDRLITSGTFQMDNIFDGCLSRARFCLRVSGIWDWLSGSPASVRSFHIPKSSVNIFCLLSIEHQQKNAHAHGLGDYLLVEASGPEGHCIQNLTCDLEFLWKDQPQPYTRVSKGSKYDLQGLLRCCFSIIASDKSGHQYQTVTCGLLFQNQLCWCAFSHCVRGVFIIEQEMGMVSWAFERNEYHVWSILS